MNLTPTISVLELVYALVALYGLIVTTQNALDALADYRVIGQRRLNGGRRIVARGNIRREYLRIGQLAGCLVIALYAMTRPPMPGFHPIQVLIVPACLIVIEVTCVINSASDRHDRKALIALLNAIYHAGTQTAPPLHELLHGEDAMPVGESAPASETAD